jgi:hypothetical protein
MTKYKGGDKVGKGTYWNFANGSMVHIPDEGVLQGDDKKIYMRVPAIAVLVISPIIGLVYITALPFIAIGLIVGKILGSLFDLLRAFASFEWAPNEAHLIGKRKKKKKENKSDQTE